LTDTFATFLNALQEKHEGAEASRTLSVSQGEASETTEMKILALLRDHPNGLAIDTLRDKCGFSFMVLAQTLTSLLDRGKVNLSGEPGKELVQLTSDTP
jgi:hypothetical protein